VRAESDTNARVYHTIAERIDAACRALNLKQRELAERAGLPSRQRLTQIKSGERPGRKHVEALAGLMGCTVEWLTTGTGQAPSWAAPRPTLRAGEPSQTYGETPDLDGAPPWALRLLGEVQALRDEVAELRGKRTGEAAAELDRTLNPDEYPRTKAPTYPRPAAVPGEPPRGR
jgi:transcriptional regulator with XRE-family HTH domain